VAQTRLAASRKLDTDQFCGGFVMGELSYSTFGVALEESMILIPNDTVE
jgi:hypothetical protein